MSASFEPRPLLRPLSWLYGLGVRSNRWTYDRGWRNVRRLPVPVVSVGNLAAGGTGKTPFVCALVARYRAAGLRVGVLARGYGRRPGEVLNDEGRLLERRFDKLPQRQDPDRYQAGLRLLDEHGLDVIVLDDGFQHRRLHRDLDICLLDAARPFGGGLLPGGWLREPPSSLARADVIVLSGANSDGSVSRAATPDAEQQLRSVRASLAERFAPRPVLRCTSRIASLFEAREERELPLDALAGRDCVLVAGIARPERFVHSIQELGARVVATQFVRDHSVIDAAQLEQWSAQAKELGALLVWTEKDEARAAFVGGQGPARIVPRIELVFDEEPELTTLLPSSLHAHCEGAG